MLMLRIIWVVLFPLYLRGEKYLGVVHLFLAQSYSIHIALAS